MLHLPRCNMFSYMYLVFFISLNLLIFQYFQNMLKHCPSCNSKVLWKFISLDTQYAWKENVTCMACGMCGSICNMCPRSKIFISRKKIQNHTAYHKKQKNNLTKITNIDIDTELYNNNTPSLYNFDYFGCDFSSNVSMDDTYALCSLPRGVTFCTTNRDASHLSEESLQGNNIYDCTESATNRFEKIFDKTTIIFKMK